MTAAVDPRLLQEFLELGQVVILDEASKAALRLCSKQMKDYVDATVVACKVKAYDLNALLKCSWPLTKIEVEQGYCAPEMCPVSFTFVLFDLICKFPLLESLRIGDIEELEELPENIGELSTLKEFVVTGGDVGLKALPPSFGQLTTLERFELINCNYLPLDGLGPLKHLTQLKHLEMRGYILREPLFPEWVCSCDFPLLKDLCLEELSAFPSSIGNFKNLTKLELEFDSANYVDVHLPESIGALSLLQDLSLSTEEPISLPDSFSRFTTLEKLKIIADIVKGDIAPLQHLTGLTKLQLSRFRTEDDSDGYPDFLCNLTLLKTLSLRHSDVCSLPDALGNLINLERLELEYLKHLLELPESIRDLAALKSLTLDACSQLERLPESIGNLAALNFLSLRKCGGLKSLPDSFGNLAALKTLTLDACSQLERLPDSFGNLAALELLALDECRRLKSLPASIGDLNNLKTLRLWGLTEVVFSEESILVLAWLKERGVWDP